MDRSLFLHRFQTLLFCFHGSAGIQQTQNFCLPCFHLLLHSGCLFPQCLQLFCQQTLLLLDFTNAGFQFRLPAAVILAFLLLAVHIGLQCLHTASDMFLILLCCMDLFPQNIDLSLQFFFRNTGIIHTLLQFTNLFICLRNLLLKLLITGFDSFKFLPDFRLLMLCNTTFLLQTLQFGIHPFHLE